MPVMSARNWQRKLLALAPPSTFTERILVPESDSMARMTSFAWKAMDSRAARAMWHLLVPLVRPMIMPLAFWSQWGAPRPTNAGTT